MKIKVFVVDDSTFDVQLLKDCFNGEEVVGVNSNCKNLIDVINKFNLNQLEGIILRVNDFEKNKYEEDESINIKLTNLLHDLGIPSNIKGFLYIRAAILMVYNNPSFIGSITKNLYTALSIKFNTSNIRVERAIRHAIEVSWNRGDLELMDKIFGHSISMERSKPTNSEFIATIADKLRLEN